MTESQAREVEELSSQLHDIYIKEAKRQGDVRHKDKYADLPENIKEFDRVLARFIIKDRRRIVEPLVKVIDSIGNITTEDFDVYKFFPAINKTLRRAGLEK